jgi:hypothetical protein
MTELFMYSLVCDPLPTADSPWRKLNGTSSAGPLIAAKRRNRFPLDKSHNGSYITVMVEGKTGEA